MRISRSLWVMDSIAPVKHSTTASWALRPVAIRVNVFINCAVSSSASRSHRASLLGKMRYSVLRPTLARRAMSSIFERRSPNAVNSALAASRMRSCAPGTGVSGRALLTMGTDRSRRPHRGRWAVSARILRPIVDAARVDPVAFPRLRGPGQIQQAYRQAVEQRVQRAYAGREALEAPLPLLVP